MTATPAHLAIRLIAALATAGVVVRRCRLPAVWAAGGAVLLLIVGLLPWNDGIRAVGRGTDVYLFLTGMMLLSEVARREGVFDWLAARAANAAAGRPGRLFALVHAIGIVVTQGANFAFFTVARSVRVAPNRWRPVFA